MQVWQLLSKTGLFLALSLWLTMQPSYAQSADSADLALDGTYGISLDTSAPIIGQKLMLKVRAINLSRFEFKGARVKIDVADEQVCVVDVNLLAATYSLVMGCTWMPNQQGFLDITVTISADITELNAVDNQVTRRIYIDLDSDNDGDPNRSDLDDDNDTLSDDQEEVLGTNPLLSDSDRDGMRDDFEVRYDFDPLDGGDARADADEDGLSNLVEFLRGTDPLVATSYTQPVKANLEPQPENASSEEVVEDNPQLPVVQLDNEDQDGDGVIDGEDAFPANPLYHRDADQDGMPDEWEMRFGLSITQDDSEADKDIDGLSNLDEYLNKTDPTNVDSDSDGVFDGYEVDHGYDPMFSGDGSFDLDKDGLTVADEFRLGTDPDNPDTDGDTLNDRREFELGTDPLKPDTDNDGIQDGLDPAPAQIKTPSDSSQLIILTLLAGGMLLVVGGFVWRIKAKRRR